MSEQLIDGQVIPYENGRKNHDTAAWRDATDLEMSQAQQIQELEDKVGRLHEANQAMIESLNLAVTLVHVDVIRVRESEKNKLIDALEQWNEAIAKGKQQ